MRKTNINIITRGPSWYSIGSLRHSEAHPDNCKVCMVHRRHILNHTRPPCYHEKDLKSNEGTGLLTPEVSTAIFAFHKELQSGPQAGSGRDGTCN